MGLKTKILSKRFKNNSYFKDLEYYISCRVNENKLDYNKLKYLYCNLYKGYSGFIKQNIYPVGEFLSEGYSFNECEKIVELLEDATGKTIFCYEKREQGYRFNKLFTDLKFGFDKYSEFIKCGNDKNIAFEKLKKELKLVPIEHREIIVALNSDKYIHSSEIESYYKYVNNEINSIRKEFSEVTKNDKRLQEYFKKHNYKDRFSEILVAGTILGGIDLRNLQRENNNLDGEFEKYPYTQEQIDLVNRYNRLQNTLEKINNYVEKESIEKQEELEYEE